MFLTQASDIDVTSALSTLTSIMSSAMSIITGNAVLMVMFTAGLLAVGFKLIRKAKGAVK